LNAAVDACVADEHWVHHGGEQEPSGKEQQGVADPG
jgi:hypothetical protein